MLTHILDGVSTSSVDGFKIDDLIFAVSVPDDVSKNSVYSHCGIGDNDDVFDVGVEDFSEYRTGFIDQFGGGVTDEWIR